MNDELEGFRRILLKRCVGSFGLLQHISDCLQYLFDDISNECTCVSMFCFVVVSVHCSFCAAVCVVFVLLSVLCLCCCLCCLCACL